MAPRGFDLEAFRRAVEPAFDELGVRLEQVTYSRKVKPDGTVARAVRLTGTVYDVTQGSLELEGK